MAKNLLSVAADAKTIKGASKGYLTGVLYLAPHTLSGFQVCPSASEGCRIGCLYTAGRGIYSKVQNARIAKTQAFFADRDAFIANLVKNIESLARKAARLGMIPVVRLNGTSDLPFEKFPAIRNSVKFGSLMEAFPEIQFYDYTKILGRKKAIDLPNYHLTFSLSEDNDKRAVKAMEQGYNVCVVMHVGRKEEKPRLWSNRPVYNGDETDLRFLDPAGHIIGLFPKGKARKDTSGFVRRVDEGFRI